MVRSPSPSSHSRGLSSRDRRGQSPRMRPRARSPHGRINDRRKSPIRHASPRRRSLDARKNGGRNPNRNLGRRGGGVIRGGRHGGGNIGQGKKNKRGKWRRRNKKKRHRVMNLPGAPPVSGGNRQPIASMRMRMDDYIPPRTGRLIHGGKGVDIEHAVARARREASTRTKDTFWTKKLLDAEESYPNRSRSRVSRSPKRLVRKRPKSPTVSRSRSKSPIIGKKSRSSKSPPKKKVLHSPGSRRVFRSNKRSYSRSPSTSSFSSYSSSYSRSYSSYSRSSSTSSFTSTSSASSLSFHRRSYSRSSRSFSRSPSPRKPVSKIRTASLSKAVQSVHVNQVARQETKKKVVTTKTVSNTVKIQNSTSVSLSKNRLKVKPKNDPIRKKMHNTEVVHLSGDYYTKELPLNKEPHYISSGKMLQPTSGMNSDLHYFKNPPNENYHRTVIAHKVPTARSEGEESESESSSEDDGPRKMTLSERFGKLAQLSSQRQEYEGVRMKIVREGGQDKKVYLEGGGSRTPSPIHRRLNHPAHERWLREHQAEYDEYQQRYGEFRHWDPHRDLPRELPPNWDDVNVRYRYYKESGYFGDRAITMEDYLKWEEWWYRYRDWLEKYGGMQDIEKWKHSGPYEYEGHRSSSTHWVARRDSSREKEDRKRRRYP